MIHSAGVQATAGTAARPMMSLFAGASNGGKLIEVGCFNTTATALAIFLTRLTAQGTPGAGLTESNHDPASPSLMTAFTTHTADATLGDDLGYRAVLGAAVGSAVIWTMSKGITIPVGTANGIGIILENGTGQVCQVYFVWEE
ncbi:hypothetical protein LCGC14_2152910 [marine sediment metagenome]|uniref:Uncharacterized protein n=1 Tax=marine sediment metagenome TaxID=412755 RepID=A0A0F9EH70_9ZZZZ